MKSTLPIRIITILFCIAGLADNSLFAQRAENSPSENTGKLKAIHKTVSLAGAKNEGLNIDALEKIDLEMTSQVEKEKIIGCSALIFNNGKEVFYGHWGQRDREDSLPIERDTIFRIYSMSKPITSIAVMQLVGQGKIKLDAPVSDYLPELDNMQVLTKSEDDGDEWTEVPAKRPITVRDLLRHTSGFTYGFFGDSEVDKRYRKSGVLMTDQTIQQTVEKLGKLPLLNQPGSRFHYSVSTDVLGRLVEVVSEESFDAYLERNIFQPLKMVDTSFVVPKDKQDRLAQLYAPASGNLKPARPMSSYRFTNQKNKFFSGGGGLCSTIDDYLRFSRMLLGNGSLDGIRIVKPETLKLMFTNQLDTIENPPRGFQFGLGFSISKRGDYSWGGAAGTRFWVNPSKNLAVLYMIQINPYGRRKHGEFVLDAAYKSIR